MKHFEAVLGGVALSLGSWACAPEPSGPDQVADVNYQLTASADEALDNVSYPDADAVMEELVGPGGFAKGCALGLVKDGEVVYLKGYGWADEGAASPWDVGTTSAVGSVSKTFTALALLRLVEKGELALDDTIGAHLAPAGVWGQETLEALLLHTTGVGGATKEDAFAPSFGPGPDEGLYPVEHPMAHPRFAYDAYAPYTAKAAVVGTTSGYENAVYSNVGYAMLGAVIDATTANAGFAPGNGYERFLWYEVGRGTLLGKGLMTMALGHSWRDGDIPGLAQGYDVGAPVEMWNGVGPVEGWEGPAGGWTMTIGDLARFVAAMHRREIVSPSSWSAAMTPRSWVVGKPYGYGMFVETVPGFPGVKRLSHGGDILGYSALWSAWEGMDDDPPFGVALECNQKGSDVLYRAAEDLFSLYVVGRLEPEFPIGSGRAAARFRSARLGSARVGIPRGLLLEGREIDPRTGTLATRFGRVRLEGLERRGATVSGTLDVRRLSRPLRGLCERAPTWGLACEPCDDGAEACVKVALEGDRFAER